MKELVDARETMLARHRLELAMMNQAINAAAALQHIEPEGQRAAPPPAQTPNRPTVKQPAIPARKRAPVKTQAVQTAGRATPQPKAGSVPALILKALQQTKPPGTTSAAIYTWLVAKHPDMKAKLDNGLHVGLKQLFKQGRATRTVGPDGEFLYLLQPANAPAQKKVTIPGLDGAPKPVREMSEAEAREALALTLKHRDQAVAAGNDVLSRIYQDRVGQLEKKLGE